MASPPTQRVYEKHGVCTMRTPALEEPAYEPARKATIADTVPVTRVMSRQVICAREDTEAAAVLELVIRNRIGCVPVVDEYGKPIGIITKLDLIDQTSTRAVHPTTNDIMMPLAITLDEHASLAHAAALMALEDIHHIPVVADSGILVGIVSTMDIVRWLAANDGLVARSE